LMVPAFAPVHIVFPEGHAKKIRVSCLAKQGNTDCTKRTT
jgi:hypothetical protein